MFLLFCFIFLVQLACKDQIKQNCFNSLKLMFRSGKHKRIETSDVEAEALPEALESSSILLEAEAEAENMPLPLPLCFKVAIQTLVYFC
jgi:hypothetical protein